MRLLKYLWAAPWTLIGLLLSLFFERRRWTRGILFCEGASWPRKLGWNYRAITFGHVVLCVDRIDSSLIVHEVAHVRQYEKWGPLFVPAYFIAAAWARAKGRHHHADNHFEIQAMAAEPKGTGTSPKGS